MNFADVARFQGRRSCIERHGVNFDALAAEGPHHRKKTPAIVAKYQNPIGCRDQTQPLNVLTNVMPDGKIRLLFKPKQAGLREDIPIKVDVTKQLEPNKLTI